MQTDLVIFIQLTDEVNRKSPVQKDIRLLQPERSPFDCFIGKNMTFL